MKIVTQDGFLYELDLSREDERTLITGGDWDDLIEHYCLYYHDQIFVNLVADQEFFMAVVSDADDIEKMMIEEPGYTHKSSYFIKFVSC